VKRWIGRFGPEETERILAVNNEIPGLTLRINKLKITPAEFLTLLDKSQITYQGSAFIDYFLKVRSLGAIAQMNIFQSGYFSIQDESAALPVILLAPSANDRVIDMCAAPGGKTTFIAELMGNKGHILAVDKYESKLKMIETSCARLGITNVQRMIADSAHLETEPADKILVDAPCSGLGVLRKKPDIKWKREPDDLTRLNKIQRELLENAARLLKPGGVLVYSTCTTEPEENVAIIRGFLAGHPEFSIGDAAEFVNRSVVTTEGWIETFPHLHHIDGSFAVRLVKAT
jgi:16S rRNA (cytosine967-C5)-methyltransferase